MLIILLEKYEWDMQVGMSAIKRVQQLWSDKKWIRKDKRLQNIIMCRIIRKDPRTYNILQGKRSRLN